MDILEKILRGNNVQTSSSKMLLLNVEDILGYALIQNGRFQKNCRSFSIKRAVQDIIDIQSYQAISKGIQIVSDFINFPPKNSVKDQYRPFDNIPVKDQNHVINSDEKRIK